MDWISTAVQLPQEETNPNTHDYAEVLCATVWGDVRSYKFGRGHFWHGSQAMDDRITHWMYLPKHPYHAKFDQLRPSLPCGTGSGKDRKENEE